MNSINIYDTIVTICGGGVILVVPMLNTRIKAPLSFIIRGALKNKKVNSLPLSTVTE